MDIMRTTEINGVPVRRGLPRGCNYSIWPLTSANAHTDDLAPQHPGATGGERERGSRVHPRIADRAWDGAARGSEHGCCGPARRLRRLGV